MDKSELDAPASGGSSAAWALPSPRGPLFGLVAKGAELLLVGHDEPGAGGVLLARPTASAPWAERELPPLPFQLTRILCRRVLEDRWSPSRTRGCVSSRQLAAALPFRSRYANEENVRHVVMRLRGACRALGVPELVAVAPGRGYYLTCAVQAPP